MGRSFHAGLRSEKKALLQVLLRLWQYHEQALNGEHCVVEGVPLPQYIEVLSQELALCVD